MAEVNSKFEQAGNPSLPHSSEPVISDAQKAQSQIAWARYQAMQIRDHPPQYYPGWRHENYPSQAQPLPSYLQGRPTGYAHGVQHYGPGQQNYGEPMQNFAQPPQNFAQHRGHAPMQNPSHASAQRAKQYRPAAPSSQQYRNTPSLSQQYGSAAPLTKQYGPAPPSSLQALEAFKQAHPNHGLQGRYEPIPNRGEGSDWTPFTAQPTAEANTTLYPAGMFTSTRPEGQGRHFIPQQPSSSSQRDFHIQRSQRGGRDDDDEEDHALPADHYSSPARTVQAGPSNKPALISKASATSTSITPIAPRDRRICTIASTLAQDIKSGQTEDPADEALWARIYTPRTSVPMPSVGPVLRLPKSRMFSTVGDVQPPAPTSLIRSGLGPSGDVTNPDWLSIALDGLYHPTMDELMEDVPVTELYRAVDASTAGVIKISDLPYETTRAEVSAYIGGRAQILHLPETSPYPSIHIIMERETGKTLDCYVELSSLAEANLVLRNLARCTQDGRPPMIGLRTPTTHISSQAELMADLFPRAKHVSWRGGEPLIDTTPRSYYENETAAGFQGFINPEELVMTLHHAALKERAPFAGICITRPYDTLISIMYKFPWYAPKHIRISERDRIFNTVLRLVGSLVNAIENRDAFIGPTFLTLPLLQEMVVAALVCPGFSETQKAKIIGNLIEDGHGGLVHNTPASIRLGGMHPFASSWPFAALSMIPGCDNAVIQYYLQCLYHGNYLQNGRMGSIKFDYRGSDNPSDLTLSTAGKIEFAKIEELLEEFSIHLSGPAQLRLTGAPPDRDHSPASDSRSESATVVSSRTAVHRRLGEKAASCGHSDRLTVLPSRHAIERGGGGKDAAINTATDVRSAAEVAAAAENDPRIVGAQRRRAYTLAQAGTQRRQENAIAQAHPEDLSGELEPSGAVPRVRGNTMDKYRSQYRPSIKRGRELNVVRGTYTPAQIAAVASYQTQPAGGSVYSTRSDPTNKDLHDHSKPMRSTLPW